MNSTLPSRWRGLAVAFSLLTGVAIAEPSTPHTPPGLFPFVLPWDDASPGVANVSAWLDKPAGTNGFVTVRDGHLYTGGKRIRFFGVNLVFSANFPTHAASDGIAARMAKFGINAVRFHHMDCYASPGGIFTNVPSTDPRHLRTLDPGQMDKLDYLIAQLKRHGIYADLNLHVSRTYPGVPQWEGMPGYHKGVDFFHPRALELQREFARDLLTHRNPYTGTRYADEPAVAFVEINNECGLIAEWWGGRLDGMPSEVEKELAGPWRAWLRATYTNDAALRTAWGAKADPLGTEALTNGDFRAGLKGFHLEQHGGARATAAATDGALRISVTSPGTADWHVQIGQGGVRTERGRLCTIAFRAKADSPRRISASLSQNHAPWQSLAGSQVRLTTQWQAFALPVSPSATETNARVMLSGMGMQTGVVWLADLSLRPGGLAGLHADEGLDRVAVFRKRDYAGRTADAQMDWIRFLWSIEERYWMDMRRFVRDELGVRAIVFGTQIGFSPQPIQALFDVTDIHSYWKHPTFPGKPWDMGNWLCQNVSMAAAPDGGTLPALIARRLPGKPYLVTEYNHSAPNTYSSEAFPMIAATAGREDWDGVFVFAYSHRRDDWDARHILGFFDIDQHPTKMVTLPPAAAMFCRGDVPASPQPLAPLSIGEAQERARTGGSWAAAPAALPMRNTNEVFVVDSPRSKAVVGFVRGRRFDLGTVSIAPGPTLQDWAAITVTELSEGRWLVTATGYAENTGMGWKNAEKTTVGRDWGTAPSLVEGIPATITFPVPVRAWALDERGARREKLPETGVGVTLGPQWQTLWYEVESR